MVDSIERMESSANELSRGLFNDVQRKEAQILLAHALLNEITWKDSFVMDEPWPEEILSKTWKEALFKDTGHRISEGLVFEYKGTVEVSLHKTAETPIGTKIELDISTDGGDTWQTVDQGGSLTITAEEPTNIKMKAKQNLYTRLYRLHDEELDSNYEIPDSALQEDDEVKKVLEDVVGISSTRDRVSTPKLDEVETTIVLVDGNMRERGQMLLRGKFWSQDIENGTS